MNNPANNKVFFTPDGLIDSFHDEEGNSIIPEIYHINTIKCWIRKYCTDRGYNKSKEVLALIKNFETVFNKLNIHGCIEDQHSIINTYTISAINRQITLSLKIDSFAHEFELNITFFLGLKDEIQISVSRLIFDDLNNGVYDSNKHALSLRGIYHVFDDGIGIQKPFAVSSIYTFLTEFTKNESEAYLNKEILGEDLIEKLKEYYAICKFYNLKDEVKSNYLDENGKILIDDVINNIQIDNNNYIESTAINLANAVNPVMPELLKFESIEPFMIPFKFLFTTISEIIINSVLYDSIDIVANMNQLGGKNVVSDEIYKKGNELLYQFVSLYLLYVQRLLKLDCDDDSELKSVLELTDVAKNELIEEGKIVLNDDDLNSFHQEYIDEKTKDEIEENKNSLLDNDEYVKEMLESMTFDDENEENNNNIKEIWTNIFKEMNDRYNTKDYYKKFKLKNLESISNIESANLMLYANFDALYGIYNFESTESYPKYINFKKNDYYNKVNKIYAQTVKDCNINMDLKFVNKLYKDYVFPIKNKVGSVCQNIEALNDSFNTLFSGAFNKKEE